MKKLDEIKEKVERIINLKAKLTLLAKFENIKRYDSKIISDLAKNQEEALLLLYKKFLIYYNEEPKITIEIEGKIKEILEELVKLERELAKTCGPNFGIRQPIIHCLNDDEEFLFYIEGGNSDREGL
ncbi:hypothetical protein [Methanocaldococcus infernus]|uniref:Uncharacterized protein n=1 Tax=Methanocaldococcus infernus (strain DSM 11812 / JCM 15783 / ME) TaxID=573063 RepID=D5VRY9_METIM|nr:hypothetical protein [Methanocaldococcus infernus]ADG13342.1 conserved hypothetical protein [Methanocaldococcus infernus ME]